MSVKNILHRAEENDIMEYEGDAAAFIRSGAVGVDDDDDEVPSFSIKEQLDAISILECVQTQRVS